MTHSPWDMSWQSLSQSSDEREQARQAAREAICRLFSPLPHPYYDFLLREQGFSAAADAAQKLVPAGKLKQAADTIPDEAIDRLTIAGTPAECRKRIAQYEGIVEEVICVNVSYATPQMSDPLGSYRSIINLRWAKVNGFLSPRERGKPGGHS